MIIHVNNYFLTDSVTKDQFELLCRDGSRKSVDEYATCNWGEIPSNAIVVSSATNQDKRKFLQGFLEESVRIFGKHENNSRQSNNNEFYNNNNNNNRYDNRYDNRQDRGYEDEQDGEYNPYNRRENYNNFSSSSGFYDRSTQEPQIQSIEKFFLFESAPRYGRQHNLMFSVTKLLFSYI